jgi:hypothetical protein
MSPRQCPPLPTISKVDAVGVVGEDDQNATNWEFSFEDVGHCYDDDDDGDDS